MIQRERLRELAILRGTVLVDGCPCEVMEELDSGTVWGTERTDATPYLLCVMPSGELVIVNPGFVDGQPYVTWEMGEERAAAVDAMQVDARAYAQWCDGTFKEPDPPKPSGLLRHRR